MSAARPLPRIAAVVLAAGESRRMGNVNKLLASIEGVPMVARAVDAALGAQTDGVFVVTGFEAGAVTQALGRRPVTLVHNADYADGLSTSLRHGIAALPASAEGAIVCLGDMPRVGAAHIRRLIDAFDGDCAACVPTFAERRGNPVLWARRLFPEIMTVGGDRGARGLMEIHAAAVRWVSMDDDAVLRDVDDPASLLAAGGGGTAP